MSDLDLKPLLSGGSAFERSLLRAGRDDAPTPALEAKILASLEASALPPAQEIPRAARDSMLARFVKPRGLVTAVAVAGLGAALVGYVADRGPSPALAPTPGNAASTSVVVRAPESPPPPVSDDRRGIATVTPDSLPSAPSVPSASAPASRAAAANHAAPSLDREIALLDAVKAKLGAGSADEAARALDAYDAEVPRGVLRQEATVLRIRTLLLQGNGPAAHAMADDFLAKDPSSVHAKRIRTLLGR